MFKTFTLACVAAMVEATNFTNNLAQVAAQAKAQGSATNCKTSANRMKKAAPSWSSIEAIAAGYIYQDGEFTPDDSSLFWADQGEQTPDGLKGETIYWKTMLDVFKPRGRTLFGNGASPDDINQGVLGNCWFLAAASAIAEVPGRMEGIFLNKGSGLSPQGAYGIRFYTLGVAHNVVVDDYLPLYKAWDGEYQTLFSKAGKDGSLWTAVIEKAFAKHHGNYLHIEGGDPAIATRTMTGSPYERFDHKKINAGELFAKLQAHDAAGDIMTACSPAGSDKTTSSSGLVQGHAFTVIGVKVTSAGDKLVKIRNPHGSEKYKGAWSDMDGRWTPELLKELGHTLGKDDGVFWMDIGNFAYQFSASRANYNVKNWNNDFFLMKNDPTPDDGKKSWCGAGCKNHKLVIMSEADQKVYVTANTWDKRSLSKSCQSKITKSHSIGPDANNTNWTFKGGSQQLPAYDMKANSTQIVEFEFFASPELSNDWSVTAWGQHGKVHVIHKDGLRSAGWAGEPAPAAKPALPAWDPAGFTAFANEEIGKAGVYNWTEKKVNGEKWVWVSNNTQSWNLKWTFSYMADDWKDKLILTGTNPGDHATCTQAGNVVNCEAKTPKGTGAGWVLPKGHSQYYSYSLSSY